MNRQLTLTFILAFISSLLIVTAFSQELKIKQIYSLPLKVTKAGANKLTVHVSWDGTEEAEDGIISNISGLFIF